jgi:hypothetical protein
LEANAFLPLGTYTIGYESVKEAYIGREGEWTKVRRMKVNMEKGIRDRGN